MVELVSSQAAVFHLLWSGATVCLSLGILAWLVTTDQEVRGRNTFAVIVVFSGICWQLLTALNIAGVNLQFSKPVFLIELFVVIVASVPWPVFVSKYTKLNFHSQWPVVVTLGIILLGFPLAAATNSWHGLILADVSYFEEPFSYAVPQYGPGFFVFYALTQAIVGYSLYCLVRFLQSTRQGAMVRIALLGVGVLVSGVITAVAIFGGGTIGMFTFLSHSALPFFLATSIVITRFDLFDIVPVARNALVESLTDPVVVVDSDGNLIDYNRASTRLWPNISNHVGDPLDTACPNLAANLNTDIVSVTDSHREQIVLSDDGESTYFSVLATTVTEGSQELPVGHAILLRDITELEQSRQQLEQQNQQLDRVASTISHDLRNPVSIVQGYGEVLMNNLDGEEGEYAENIENAARRMEEIINDVLTLAREGQLEETSELDIDRVARNAWETVDTDSARLVVESTCRIEANESQLRTIFENLFRNAIDHNPTMPAEPGTERTNGGEESELTITVGVWQGQQDGETVSTSSSDDTAGFYIQDDGTGIPPDAREKLFEYGYTTDDDGTGLGLAIVDTMASTHDWSVSLDAGYDDGARFVFEGVETKQQPEVETDD